MNKRRIAVTGLGVVSPLGHDVETNWQQLMSRTSGMGQISHFDASHFPVRIAAEVKAFSSRQMFKNKMTRYATHFTYFALEAAYQAFMDAGIRPERHNARRFGVVVGAGMMTAEFDYLKRFQETCARDGTPCWDDLQEKTSDFFRLADFGKTLPNSGLSLLVDYFGIEGFATSVHTACASGGQALGLALQVLRRNEADCVLAGGFDSMINPLGLSSFCLLGALSTYNDTPETASRPFDGTRNGFVLGEGAAFLVLEDLEKARLRKAKIYAELAGEGNSLSSYRITDSPPDGNGAIQAIRRALEDAGIQPEEIDYINAHGTSTKMNDLSETNAIKACFGDKAKSIPVSSTKSQTGHLISAAGAIEAVFSSLAIHHQQIPQTANRHNPDPDCDLDFVTEGPRQARVQAVLSNSFGFGGSNSCLVFKHPEYEGAK